MNEPLGLWCNISTNTHSKTKLNEGIVCQTNFDDFYGFRNSKKRCRNKTDKTHHKMATNRDHHYNTAIRNAASNNNLQQHEVTPQTTC